MRHFISALAFIIASFACYAQTKDHLNIDSLISAARYDDALQAIDNMSGGPKNGAQYVMLQNKRAEILITQGKLDQAENVLKNIGSTADAFLEAVTQTNRGFIYLSRARNDLALTELEAAFKKFQSADRQLSREAAVCLADLSLVFLNTGKYNQALENGLLALQIREKLSPSDKASIAASYNDLGLVYSHSDPDKALEYYENALNVYTSMLGQTHPKIAQAKSNIGIMYQQLGLYGDAINNFESADSILKVNYPSGHPSQAFAQVNLGLAYLKLKDKSAAVAYLTKALSVYRQFYGEKHSDIASVQNQLGLISLSNRDWSLALDQFQQAICANDPAFSNRSYLINPSVRNYYNGKVMLYSLRLKAQALEAMYYGKTLKADQLRLALRTLQSCDTLIDDIRHHSTDENDKIELGESANETYEDGVRIAEALSEVSVDSKLYRGTAFYFAEKSKSAVLQESIADAEAKSFAGIPDALLEQEKNLRSTLTLLNQKLAQKPSPAEEQYLRQTLYDLNLEYDAFVARLEKEFPNYYNLKYNAKFSDVPALQKLLDGKTAIVSYFIADKTKKLYIFTITDTKFRLAVRTMPDDFDRHVKGFTNSIQFSEMSSYKRSAPVLARTLLPHFPKRISNVVLIPAGRLGTIPFEALPYKKIRANDFRDVHYLAERFSTGYEFSTGLLAQKAINGKRADAPSIFLCAPVSFSADTQLDGLPGTEKEIQNIAGLFGPSASVTATMAQATEKLAKSGQLAKFNYLHFATHGKVDEVNPELSRIYLNEGSGEDGSLFAGEIYDLELHADLAILSACQTGLGKYSKGEGVIGLSRALVYAGAKNIIVSFWSVADESTSLLMTDFYRGLLAQPQSTFRDDLRKAKLDMIHNGKYAAPYYWAPFVLIGF